MTFRCPFLKSKTKVTSLKNREVQSKSNILGTVKASSEFDFDDQYTKSRKSEAKAVKPRSPRVNQEWDKKEFEGEEDENNEVLSIDLDDLLKQPDQVEDGTKTLDEVLDDIDRDIKHRQEKHIQEMEILEKDIEAERKRKEEARLKRKRNAELRDRLESEVTEYVIKDLFDKNKNYLERVWSGKIDSTRHKAYHKGIRTRQALFYTMITDPFTDDQLKWTLDHISRVWMRDAKEQMDNNEYIWKVLLPECFIKFYMDHFGFDRAEAERRISETPLKQDYQSSDKSEDEL